MKGGLFSLDSPYQSPMTCSFWAPLQRSCPAPQRRLSQLPPKQLRCHYQRITNKLPSPILGITVDKCVCNHISTFNKSSIYVLVCASICDKKNYNHDHQRRCKHSYPVPVICEVEKCIRTAVTISVPCFLCLKRKATTPTPPQVEWVQWMPNKQTTLSHKNFERKNKT